MPKLRESITKTEDITIRAIAQYIPTQSDPQKNRYFFAYRVTIINQGDLPMRLLSRHWIIIDSDGQKTEVKGPGVVGEQPYLEKGQTFSYTSYCPLITDFGTMEGFFHIRLTNGHEFLAEIGRFYLAANAEIEEGVTL